jgi:hypothetical protein
MKIIRIYLHKFLRCIYEYIYDYIYSVSPLYLACIYKIGWFVYLDFIFSKKWYVVPLTSSRTTTQTSTNFALSCCLLLAKMEQSGDPHLVCI